MPTLIAFSRDAGLGNGGPASLLMSSAKPAAPTPPACRRSRARAHGIPVAAGSDAGGRAKEHGCLAHELDQLVRAGLSPAEAVAAATSAAASAARRGDLGALAPGRLADIIAVEGDPTADIGTLFDVRTVMAAGRPVKVSGTEVGQ